MPKPRALILFALPLCLFAQAGPPTDLFLLIGQSNMAGRGEMGPQDREPIDGVLTLDRELKWVPARDPLHFDKTIAGVGLGCSFARWLRRENPQRTIGLIPAAVGGTSLDEWNPGGALYKEALRRTRAALSVSAGAVLRGVLWHQGEADSVDESKARSYRERFAKLAAALRRDLDAPQVPIVVGQLGEFLARREGNKSPHSGIVNEQLALIPLAVAHVAVVSSAGLGHKGDEVHFDSPALRELGRRYALAFLSLDASWTARPR